MVNRPGFMISHEIYLEDVIMMTQEEKAQIFDAINQYSINGTITEFKDRFMSAVFNRYRACINASVGKYDRKCKQLAEARASKNANISDSTMNQTASTLKQTESVLNQEESTMNQDDSIINKTNQINNKTKQRWYD